MAEEKPKPKRPTSKRAREIESVRRISAKKQAQQERNLGIVMRRLSTSMSWAKIAQEFGVTAAHARRVYQDYVKENRAGLPDIDPLSVAFETYARLDQQMETYGDILVGALAAGKWDAANSALRGQREVMESQIALLQTTGIMPRELGRLRIVWETRIIVQRFVAVLDEYDVPDEIRDALLGALQEPLGELPAASSN